MCCFTLCITVVPSSGDAIAQAASEGIWKRDQDRAGYDGWKQKDPLKNDPLQDHVEDNPNGQRCGDALDAGFEYVELALALEQNSNEVGRFALFGVRDSVAHAEGNGYQWLQNKTAFAWSSHPGFEAFAETSWVEIHWVLILFPIGNVVISAAEACNNCQKLQHFTTDRIRAVPPLDTGNNMTPENEAARRKSCHRTYFFRCTQDRKRLVQMVVGNL
jgi:hypothetical protein